MKILSIVIVNWNGKGLTENCIESLLSNYGQKIRDQEIEIIVVDNGSTDGSKEYLNSIREPITILYNAENIGYAPACNQGMKKASGRYILLLGNDTVIPDKTLEQCVVFLDMYSNCGAVGCKLLNPDGSIQNNCKKFPKFKNAIYTYLSLDRLNRDYDMNWFNYDETREVEQISTTFLMIRKSVLEQIRYFDEGYKILYNDVDLCKRIWQSGAKIYFLDSAEVIHLGSQSTKKADYRLRKLMYRDIYRYYKRNFGFRALLLKPVLAARLLLVSATK